MVQIGILAHKFQTAKRSGDDTALKKFSIGLYILHLVSRHFSHGDSPSGTAIAPGRKFISGFHVKITSRGIKTMKAIYICPQGQIRYPLPIF